MMRFSLVFTLLLVLVLSGSVFAFQEGLLDLTTKSQGILGEMISDIDDFSSGNLSQSAFLRRIEDYKEKSYLILHDAIMLGYDGSIDVLFWVDTVFVLSNLHLTYSLVGEALEKGDVNLIEASTEVMVFTNNYMQQVISKMEDN